MVLTFLVGFGAVFGASEGIRASQSKSRKEEHRSRKNNLVVHCCKGSRDSSHLENRRVVLSGDKLYVDTGAEYNVPFGHPFAGYYLPYPDQRYSGLVSSITDEAPIMNWIYVHRETYEVKFGTRQYSEEHWTGPWDCTRQDRRLTFGGWEGFCAVKEGDFWSLYFDRDNDRLRGKVAPGTAVIELELIRKELRMPKPPPQPAEPPPPQDRQQERQNAGAGGQPTEKHIPEDDKLEVQIQAQAEATRPKVGVLQKPDSAASNPTQSAGNGQEDPRYRTEATLKEVERAKGKRVSRIEEDMKRIPAPELD